MNLLQEKTRCLKVRWIKGNESLVRWTWALMDGPRVSPPRDNDFCSWNCCRSSPDKRVSLSKMVFPYWGQRGWKHMCKQHLLKAGGQLSIYTGSYALNLTVYTASTTRLFRTMNELYRAFLANVQYIGSLKGSCVLHIYKYSTPDCHVAVVSSFSFHLSI